MPRIMFNGMLVLALVLLLVTGTAAAAPFDATVLKVTVDEGLWKNYHVNSSESPSGDSVTLYKVHKLEVTVMSGEREFGSHVFTPKEAGAYKVSLLHGVANVKLKVKVFAADGQTWARLLDYKSGDGEVVIKSLAAGLTAYSPGF